MWGGGRKQTVAKKLNKRAVAKSWIVTVRTMRRPAPPAGAWFDKLVASHPSLGTHPRVVEEIGHVAFRVSI